MARQYAKDQPADFINRLERVAIVGAGGEVGRPMAEELVKTGKHIVTAITRKGSTSKFPERVKAAPVDYDDEDSLVAALKGQQFLIITMSVLAPLETHHKLVVAAAKAGVPYVMPNAYTHDITNARLAEEGFSGGIVQKRIAEIESLGVSSWVVMCCSFWYEYSLALGPQSFGFDFKDKKVTFYDEGTVKINTSTWSQVGRAIAGLLSLKALPEDENDKSPSVSDWANKPLWVSSFLVSQRDMLDSLNRVKGTTDKDWTIEYEASGARYARAVEAAKKGDPTARGMAGYARVFFPTGDGDYESKYGLANDKLGLPKEDFDEATKRAVEMVESGWQPDFLKALRAGKKFQSV